MLTCTRLTCVVYKLIKQCAMVCMNSSVISQLYSSFVIKHWTVRQSSLCWLQHIAWVTCILQAWVNHEQVQQCLSAALYMLITKYVVNIAVWISGEADIVFCTTEVTSQFREAFPVLYAEYDEQETSKKKRKPKKKTRGGYLLFCDFVFCSLFCPCVCLCMSPTWIYTLWTCVCAHRHVCVHTHYWMYKHKFLVVHDWSTKVLPTNNFHPT